MEVAGSMCPDLLKHCPCKNYDCKYIHISHYHFSSDQILELNDLHYLKTQLNSAEPVNRAFSEYETKLLSNEPCPILCSICNSLIQETDFYFSCCDSFTCRKCIETWKYPNYCPTCGVFYRKLNLISSSSERLQMIKSNSFFSF